MNTALSLNQIAQLIHRHPAAFAVVAERSSVTMNDIAFAVSKMAIDPAVARDLVAMSTGRQVAEVAVGFATSIQAMTIAARTIAAHPPQQIADVFLAAATRGLGSAQGSIQ